MSLAAVEIQIKERRPKADVGPDPSRSPWVHCSHERGIPLEDRRQIHTDRARDALCRLGRSLYGAARQAPGMDTGRYGVSGRGFLLLDLRRYLLRAARRGARGPLWALHLASPARLSDRRPRVEHGALRSGALDGSAGDRLRRRQDAHRVACRQGPFPDGIVAAYGGGQRERSRADISAVSRWATGACRRAVGSRRRTVGASCRKWAASHVYEVAPAFCFGGSDEALRIRPHPLDPRP